jgi:oxepin-CoA hydrolase / 3-oxo-5,6-dehydrosuberyl-CoA semialdehyde dehydrogenase
MVDVVPSFALGSWFNPTKQDSAIQDSAIIVDATTDEPVAAVSTRGLDVGAMAAYARNTGGPALRALTFLQRARVVAALSAYLAEHKRGLYELSAQAGSTRGDAAFDIEGGINTLFIYGKRGTAELPDDTLLLEGKPDRLSKGGTFLGQHVSVPLRGVAVQINAFNFPVWGLLEKLGPALLAGMPVIAKPASQTAFVTSALVASIVDSGLLPEGALQLISGDVGDLFDHLTAQDVVAFTGSAETANRLRSHPTIVTNSVRFNAEADSLNAIILGPDVTADDPEFGLFVAEVVREMTQKTGQKCTAIRRALVPSGMSSAVLEALTRKLREIRVGDPRDREVTMGPLVSRQQRENVEAAVARLAAAAEVVLDPREVANGHFSGRGAFVGPALLWAPDADRPEPHAIEAFGPVCTVMPYETLDEAVDLAARGGGSLVATLVTADQAVARHVVEGIAAWHGRLLILDRVAAEESTGHGAAVAQLVHGGPGRAGGGAELGGLRALDLYLQRTALQGSPDMLTSLTRRWTKGAERRTDDGHPFRKYLEDLHPGDAVVAGPRQVTLADIEAFAELTGDTFYAHMDEDAARANPFFEGRVAHGYLLVALAAGLFVDPAPGPVLANYGIDNLRFKAPVNPGDELTVSLTVKQTRPREDYGEVRWDAVITNQTDESVAEYDVLTMVAKRPTDPAA